MIKKKHFNKEITFFYYEEITSTVINEVIEFIESVPKVKNSKFIDGTNILIDNIKLKCFNKKPVSISIGINFTGSCNDIQLEPKKYYYFKGSELVFVENLDDITF